MALLFPFVLLVMNLTSIGVLWFGGMRIDSGQMQVGALTAFLSYIMQILMAVMMSTMIFMIVPRAEVSAERITAVLDTETTVVPPAVPVTEFQGHGHLELRGVSFGYPGADEDVLHDISLTAEPGKTTAIIGSTGAGKTTLAQPGAAAVRRDRRPACWSTASTCATWSWTRCGPGSAWCPRSRSCSAGPWPRTCATATRTPPTRSCGTRLEIAQAARFVREMGGLDAPIAQGGTNVSGGQRQRLAIARALVRKPEIYLFDDSFSALDFATDAALRRALVPETREATVLVVAQRVSTIRHADRIVVLEDGRVVGSGTHTELMADNETYREIVLSQVTESEAA